MIEIKRITIASDEIDYIQFLNFEKSTYKELLSYILLEKANGGYEYSIDNYNHFMNELKETNIKFRLTFDELLDKYAPEYKGDDNYSAEFNFDTYEMIIYKGDK